MVYLLLLLLPSSQW